MLSVGCYFLVVTFQLLYIFWLLFSRMSFLLLFLLILGCYFWVLVNFGMLCFFYFSYFFLDIICWQLFLVVILCEYYLLVVIFCLLLFNCLLLVVIFWMLFFWLLFSSCRLSLILVVSF